MKKVEITAYGAPEAVAHCIEAPDVGAPGAGEIVFDVLAFPINPADLSMIRGNYRLQPPLPATPGAECVGDLAAKLREGVLNAPIDGCYPIEEIKAALARAQQGGRSG